MCQSHADTNRCVFSARWIVQDLDLAVADVLVDCSRVSDRRQQRNDRQDMSLSERLSMCWVSMIAVGRVCSGNKLVAETTCRTWKDKRV